MWQWKWIVQHLPSVARHHQKPLLSKQASRIIAREIIDYFPTYQKNSKNKLREKHDSPDSYKFIKFVDRLKQAQQEGIHRNTNSCTADLKGMFDIRVYLSERRMRIVYSNPQPVFSPCYTCLYSLPYSFRKKCSEEKKRLFVKEFSKRICFV